MTDKLWSSLVTVSEKMLLDKARPNPTLVEEALSFDVAKLYTIPVSKLRQYLVVLGQYLISLMYEENKAEAVCFAWQKALDSHVFMVMNSGVFGSFIDKKSSLTEKKAIILEKDEQAKTLNTEYQIAESKRTLIKNMYKPVEQYINILKKELDAREADRQRA